MKKSSMFISVLIMLIFGSAMVLTSCDKDPTSPTDKSDETMGKLILVPLGNEALSKVFVGTDGNKYLPREAAIANLEKMGRIAIRMENANQQSLAKIALAMIDFGEILNTRILQYVVMNVGNQDIFDIDFTANSLVVFPGAISVVEASEQGTAITALPIVNIAKEHVTPISGIGTLLEMTTGDFADTLTLTYKYTTGNDTVVVSDEYDVAGSKMGAVIELIFSGQNFSSYSVFRYEVSVFGDSPWNRWPVIAYSPIPSEDTDTTIIINSGNAPISLAIGSWRHNDTLLTTTLLPSDTIDCSGSFSTSRADSTGEAVIVGTPTNQPYIFKLGDEIVTTGAMAFVFDE